MLCPGAPLCFPPCLGAPHQHEDGPKECGSQQNLQVLGHLWRAQTTGGGSKPLLWVSAKLSSGSHLFCSVTEPTPPSCLHTVLVSGAHYLLPLELYGQYSCLEVRVHG